MAIPNPGSNPLEASGHVLMARLRDVRRPEPKAFSVAGTPIHVDTPPPAQRPVAV